MQLREALDSWQTESITSEILLILGSIGFLAAMRDLFPISIFLTYIILLLLTLIGGVVIFVLNWKQPKDDHKWDEPCGGLDRFLAVILWLALLGALSYFVVSAYNANRCPEVNLSASSELMLGAGQTISLEAEVSDLEDDPLTCRWSAFYDDGSDARSGLSARPFPSRNCVTTYTAPRLGAGMWVEVRVEVDDGACGRKVTKSKRIRILPWQGSTDTPTPTNIAISTLVRTPTPTGTVTPTSTDTPMPTNTAVLVLVHTLTPTSTPQFPMFPNNRWTGMAGLAILVVLVVGGVLYFVLQRKKGDKRNGSGDRRRIRNEEMSKKHVFLSYCRDNESEVAKLRDDLIRSGEDVWWDRDILPGEDWQMTLQQAMKDAYAVVFCFSAETDARPESGMFPELRDAIDAYRNYRPGSIFLIPIRLSVSRLPDIKIDSVRTLSSLQYVNLFPESRRDAGLRRLVVALQKAPHHP